MIVLLLLGCIRPGAEPGIGIGGDTGDFGGSELSCLADARREALDGWLGALAALDAGVTTPPDPAAFPAFLDVPGASAGPWFALDLSAACGGDAPEPLCAGGVCYTPACAADAAQLLVTPDADPWTVGSTRVAGAEQWITAEDDAWLVRWDVDTIDLPGGYDLTLRGIAHVGGGLTVDVTIEADLTVVVSDGEATVYYEGAVLAEGPPGALEDADCWG